MPAARLRARRGRLRIRRGFTGENARTVSVKIVVEQASWNNVAPQYESARSRQFGARSESRLPAALHAERSKSGAAVLRHHARRWGAARRVRHGRAARAIGAAKRGRIYVEAAHRASRFQPTDLAGGTVAI